MSTVTRLLGVLLGAATACNSPSKSKDSSKTTFDHAAMLLVLERFDAYRARLESELREKRPAWVTSSPCDGAGKCTTRLDAPDQPHGAYYRIRFVSRDPGLFEITLAGLPADATLGCADLHSIQRRFALEGSERTVECEPDSGGELARIVTTPGTTSVSWIKSGLIDHEQAPAPP